MTIRTPTPSRRPLESTALEAVQTHWEHFGSEDALWEMLSVPSKSNGGWDIEEFMATGEREIADAFIYADPLPVTFQHERALDFGCGVGRLTFALARRFGVVDGVDISAPMIDRARASASDGATRFHHVTAAQLPFDDDQFDFVYSRLVLQHVETELALAYIAEFARVLRPGGLALFQTPVRDLTKEGWGSASPIEFGSGTAVIEMHAHPIERIEVALESRGASVVEVQPDPCAGVYFESVRFAATC